MKKSTRMRLLSGFIAAGLLIGSLIPAVKVYADDPYQVQIDIQKSVDEAIKYQIEHPENPQPEYQKPEKPVPSPWYYGYPYYWWDYDWRCDCPGWAYSGSSDITLNEGDTYQLNIPGGGDFQSTNPSVASVNAYGVITAHHDGTCVIKVIGYKGGVAFIRVTVKGVSSKKEENKTNVVYVTQPAYNPVTTNASWLAIATNLVVATPKNGTVNLSSLTPLNFDANFANVLRLRPDVTVNVTYGFNGHTFLLTIPKGYNLASKLNPAGVVDFVTLSNVVDGKIRCRLLY
jgi:hypothetical protein